MFNVINDKWIPTNDGLYGLRELVAKAHKLKEIRGENPMQEFAIKRLLFVFLMDVYRPKTTDELYKLLDKGEFDMNAFDAYIEKCKNEGVTFEIFDEERPFLQEPLRAFGEKDDIKSIARLDAMKPTGTNKRFFDKSYERQAEFSNEKIAQLLTTPTIRVCDGRGFTSAISGTPVYVTLEGENLFETLVMGMIPENETIGYDKPYWRMGSFENKASKNKPFLVTSLLIGLTLPQHRIHVLDNKTTYYKGEFYYTAAEWRDPYVPYFEKNNGDVKALKAQEEFYRNWTNLLAFSDKNTNSLKIVEIYRDYLEDEGRAMKLTIYELLTSNSKYSDMRKSAFILPNGYLEEDIKRLRSMATMMDKASGYLAQGINKVFKNNSPSMKPYVMQHFHQQCDAAFEKRINEKSLNEETWAEQLGEFAGKVFDQAIKERLRTDQLATALKEKWKMLGIIKTLSPKKEKQEKTNGGKTKEGKKNSV